MVLSRDHNKQDASTRKAAGESYTIQLSSTTVTLLMPPEPLFVQRWIDETTSSNAFDCAITLGEGFESRRNSVLDLGSPHTTCDNTQTHPELPRITPPRSDVPVGSKRKNSASMPSTDRGPSPSKRLRLDEVLPSSSASQAGLADPTVLDSSTVLSATSNSRRSNSPTRDHAIELRNATPAIVASSLAGTRLPSAVQELRSALTHAFGQNFIPINLKVCPPYSSW